MDHPCIKSLDAVYMQERHSANRKIRPIKEDYKQAFTKGMERDIQLPVTAILLKK